MFCRANKDDLAAMENKDQREDREIQERKDQQDHKEEEGSR